MNPKTIIALVLLGLTIAGFIFLQVRKRKKNRTGDRLSPFDRRGCHSTAPIPLKGGNYVKL